jgi:hypothetical protein
MLRKFIEYTLAACICIIIIYYVTAWVLWFSWLVWGLKR